MGVPDFQTLMLPLLKLASDGAEHSLGEAIDSLGQEFQLSEADRSELLPSRTALRFNNRVGWTATYLRKAGLLKTVARGRFQITDRGRDVLASAPSSIDVRFLESRFPEMSAFRSSRSGGEGAAAFNEEEGAWTIRPEVVQRVREKLERSIPNETIRREALQLLALVIENADEERADAWYLRETSHGLALMAGRVLACKVTRSKVQLSIIGPITDGVRAAIGADAEDDEEFKSIAGSLFLTFPVDRAERALQLLREDLNGFVGLAMARVRRPSALEGHLPEAVEYVASVVGRELPQPDLNEGPDVQQPEDDADDDGEGGRVSLVFGDARLSSSTVSAPLHR